MRADQRRVLLRTVVVVAGVAAVAIALLRCSGAPTRKAEPAARPVVGGERDEQEAARRKAIAAARLRLRAELPTYTMTGIVVDRDLRPVAGATVVLAVPRRTVASGADGRFEIEGLPAGLLAVEARHGSRIGGPVQARVGPGAKPVTLRLYQGAELEVEVVDAAGGRPIAGAEVRVRLMAMFEAAGEHQGTTGRDGKVRFPGVVLIGQDLDVAAPGYARRTIGPDAAHAADGLWRVRVELTATDEVSGVVVDEAGQPVAGAIVEGSGTVEERGPRGGGASALTVSRYGAASPAVADARRVGAQTGADGRFRIGLEPGPWTLVATHPGFAPGTSKGIRVGRGAVGEVRIVLPKGRRVHGVVVDSRDNPVPGATVRVLWQFGDRLERAVTADGTGAFEVIGLPPAPLALVAVGDGAVSSPLRVDLSQPLEEELLLVLANDGVITGRVTDTQGRPVADAQVHYGEIGVNPATVAVHPSVVTSDADGRFRVAGVAQGRKYSLTAKLPQDGDWQFRGASAFAEAGDEVTLVIPDDGEIVGRVVMAGGGKLQEGFVEIDKLSLGFRLERDGRFRFSRVPPGDYTLVAGGKRAADRFVDVRVESGQTVDLGEITLSAGVELSGQVLTATGRALPQADVRVEVVGHDTLLLVSDAQGQFHAVVAEGADVVLSAKHRKAGISDPMAIAAGGSLTGVQIKMRAGGLIEGGVSAKDEPLEGWVLALYAAGDELGPGLMLAETDEAGYYRFEAVPDGDYLVELVVTNPDSSEVRRMTRRVRASAGDAAVADFDVSGGWEAAEPMPSRPERPGEGPPRVKHEAGGH